MNVIGFVEFNLELSLTYLLNAQCEKAQTEDYSQDTQSRVGPTKEAHYARKSHDGAGGETEQHHEFLVCVFSFCRRQEAHLDWKPVIDHKSRTIV